MIAIVYSLIITLVLALLNSTIQGISRYFLSPFGSLLSTVLCVYLIYMCIQCFAKFDDLSMSDCRIAKARLSNHSLFIALVLLTAFLILQICGQAGYWSIQISAIKQILLINGFGGMIAEEMVFRGYILKILELNFGKRMGIFLSSVFFSLAHITRFNGILNPFECASNLLLFFSIGVLLAFLVYKNSTIGDSIAIHVFWNLFIADKIIFSMGTSEHRHPLFTYIFENELSHPLINYTNSQWFILSSIIIWGCVILEYILPTQN